MSLFPSNVSWWFSLEFEWRKYPLVSRTLLRILADLNNAVVWMFSSCLLISNSSSPFTKPLGIVPSASTTIGITVTFMFHSFFCSLVRSRYFPSFQLLFILLCDLPGRQSSLFTRFSFSHWLLLGLVVWMRLDDLFVSENPIVVVVAVLLVLLLVLVLIIKQL